VNIEDRKEKARVRSSLWYKENKHKCKESRKAYAIKHNLEFPWKKYLGSIQARCNYPKNHPAYKNIRCRIAYKCLKKLWFDSKAYLMKKPSIHRIDSKLDYSIDNCCFIELSKNIAESNIRRTGTKHSVDR